MQDFNPSEQGSRAYDLLLDLFGGSSVAVNEFGVEMAAGSAGIATLWPDETLGAAVASAIRKQEPEDEAVWAWLHRQAQAILASDGTVGLGKGGL